MTWLAGKWHVSNKLHTPRMVEDSQGDRLRLDQYKSGFVDDVSSHALAQRLAEGQPPVFVDGLTLRQWHARYHPDSGPLRYASAAALEEGMGDELRASYGGMAARAMLTALGRRRKAVLVTLKVCRTWIETYV